MTRALAACCCLLLAGCWGPEKHRVSPSGVEWGVEVEVMLRGGGYAKFVCPKFERKPLGSHGRECYLRSYDKSTSEPVE